MRVTIKDVAEKAGVSSATVSNVINDKGKVSESTRRMVLDIIDELNFRPNASAQRRYQDAHKSIGLVIKEIHNPYFADVIVGAQEEAEAHGYELMVGSSEGKRLTEDRIIDLFVAKDVNGIIINPLLDDDTDLSRLFELKRRNIPFVLLERVRGLRASLVDVDNAVASRDAVQHLFELGHERIVTFGGPPYSMHSEERIEGFRQAFFDAQRLFTGDLVIAVGARLEDGYEAGKRHFSDWSPDTGPTAVVCYNDLIAIGLMRALHDLGLRVPQDVSVIGFDDVDLSAYAPVALSSMHVPKRQMGAKAVEVLIRHMEAGASYELEHVVLHATLNKRASTASPETLESAL